jgi:hypothetical protein
MFPKRPSVQIDKVEKIEINSSLDPFMERLIIEHHESRRQVPPYFWQPYHYPSNPVQSESEDEKSTVLSHLDNFSKGVSILSGIAVIVFVVILISGQTSIGNVQVEKLLTILSFTLVGGLVSIGGVKMFSINASLRKAKDKIERVITAERGCPFMNLFDEQYDNLRRPGNPKFCIKCPLGIDLDSRLNKGLIHMCSVYPILHLQWLQIHGADSIMPR